MFAKFRLSIRCLIAVAMVMSLLMILPTGSAAIDVVPIGGCFNTTSVITSPNTGQFNYNTAGNGDFFVNFAKAGQKVSFNFGINTLTNPDGIIGGTFQNDIELLSSQGGQIFGKMIGTSSIDANGVITFQGTILFFGGTGIYLGVKGYALFSGKIYTQDFTENGVTFKANTGSFCFNGFIRRIFAPVVTTSPPIL